jgi:glycoprotein endo-alpha-1,2-mannosidase
MKIIAKIVFGVALVFALSGCADRSAVVQADGYMVGAHYYSWYPNNWGRGCLRRILDPKQYPMLGFYDSKDRKVVEQHIAWCSQYGIDFLTLDWWPGRPGQSEYIKEVFLKAENIKDIKFCIFYETWSLSFNPDIGATAFDDKVTDTFVDSMTSLADDFFDHPSYLRVDGRPVVVLYLSRTMAGDFKHALKRLRREMAKRGHDVFIIGDEVFWNVTPIVKKEAVPHPLVTEPQVGRIRCFDAITSYNMYENELKDQAGYGAESSFISDVSSKYDEYLAAARGDVYFVPGIIPGYNDRAGRLMSDHYVIPRRWSKDGEEGSFFAKSIDDLALKYADSRLNMFMITSWNEWNEDTGIEPVKLAEPTALDRGTGGTKYTGGYKYGGYGMKYLEILRDKVVALHGRVVDEAGAPVAGAEIAVRQGDVTVKCLSDSRGYYRISRLRLKPGECEVCVHEQEVWKVELESDSSVELEDSEVEMNR